MSKNILVIDDDDFLCESLKKLFETNNYSYQSATSAKEGEETIIIHPPDLLILDLSLPDEDGVNLCRRIRSNYIFPILILTSRVTKGDKVTGLEAGADDYLTKPFESEELLARVKALLRRTNEYSLSMSNQIVAGPLRIDQKARLAKVNNKNIDLTETEFKVLVLLASNNGKAISRDALFDAAWGYQIDFNSNSLEVIIYRLRKKLADAGAANIVQTVRGYGYKFDWNNS
jgi:DNA-binding response OmpR family regulator